MWKLYLIKFFYYLLFGLIFLISLVIFFEILNIEIVKKYMGDFILNLFDKLNF
jgi:hypothetical protein